MKNSTLSARDKSGPLAHGSQLGEFVVWRSQVRRDVPSRYPGRQIQVRDLANMPRIWSSNRQISVGRISLRISYSYRSAHVISGFKYRSKKFEKKQVYNLRPPPPQTSHSLRTLKGLKQQLGPHFFVFGLVVVF